MIRSVLYLHGFLSSPGSYKAKIIAHEAKKLGLSFRAPELNLPPHRVTAVIEDEYELLAKDGPVGIVGASLGGFFAACLAAMTDARAVLINPAVEPWNIVSEYVGEQPLYGREGTFTVQAEFAEHLKLLNPPAFKHPEKTLIFLTTGDEVLNWTQATHRWSDSPAYVLDGSDHAVSDFEQHVDVVMKFLLSQQGCFER